MNRKLIIIALDQYAGQQRRAAWKAADRKDNQAVLAHTFNANNAEREASEIKCN